MSGSHTGPGAAFEDRVRTLRDEIETIAASPCARGECGDDRQAGLAELCEHAHKIRATTGAGVRAYWKRAVSRLAGKRRTREGIELRAIVERARRERGTRPPTPALQAEAREAADAVVDALASLAPRSRRLVLQADWLGVPVGELAAAEFGERSARAANAMSQALRKIRDAVFARLRDRFGEAAGEVQAVADQERMYFRLRSLAARDGLSPGPPADASEKPLSQDSQI